MENELRTIARLMNDFTEKYGLRIEAETFDCRFEYGKEGRILYRVKAITLETKKLEVVELE